jgi:hypothetical protein
MNSEELVSYINNTYGVGKAWPKSLVVSPHTYAHACQRVFKYSKEKEEGSFYGFYYTIHVTIGFKLCGLMFKNIELILGNEGDL